MIEFDAVTLAYAGQPVLRDVTLAVPEGELVLVVGPTGSGKSSLLRCLDPGRSTRPELADPSWGTLTGRVLVDGSDLHAPGSHPALDAPGPRRTLVGFVRQDPARLLGTGTVESVVAAAGRARDDDAHGGRRQVEEALDLLGLAELRSRPVARLSGGQQQRVAIAAAVVAAPRVLVLDEPTSALDPVAAEEVLAILHRLVHDVGTTVVVAEHRLERVVHHADAVLLVDGGLVSGPFDPATAMARSALRPPVAQLGVELGWDPLPLSVRDARRAARRLRASLGTGAPGAGAGWGPAGPGGPDHHDAPASSAGDPGTTPLVEARRLSVVRDGLVTLRSVDLRVGSGEVVALMGRNGAGKSTLLAAVDDSLSATSGRVGLAGSVARAPQDPRLLLSDETVTDQLVGHDLAHTLAAGATAEVLARLAPGLPVDAHPGELSEGQRMTVALAMVLARGTRVVLLDEPTRGLDYATKARLVPLLRERAASGCAVVVATHDVELAADVATRVAVLAEGELVADGPARQVLADSPAFAPQVAKVMHPVPLLRVDEVLERVVMGRPGDPA